MPGTGIPNFAEHARRIAQAGIYDLAVHHDQILAPVVLRQWDVESVTGLGPEGEQARERLMKRMAKSERVARRVTERRSALAAV
jgi:acyl-[acyl-carrier-protein] desaturase